MLNIMGPLFNILHYHIIRTIALQYVSSSQNLANAPKQSSDPLTLDRSHRAQKKRL